MLPERFPESSPAEVFTEKMIYQVTREIDFCYGHRLLNYEGKCRHLHGHNGRAVIKISSQELDDRGMVLDFSDIKTVVSKWIDENLDHRMILHHEDPAIEFLQKLNEPMFLIDSNPTAENIAKLIYEVTAKEGFPVVQVDLWETPRCFATYGKPTG
jgi:6-pyruvoyltetrahydropterin/6-carboxytetrahydropterin synthase